MVHKLSVCDLTMHDVNRQVEPELPAASSPPLTCQSIDWYAEGQARVVEIDGIAVTIRLVGRKGRRARIAITVPAGAVFRNDLNETGRSVNRST